MSGSGILAGRRVRLRPLSEDDASGPYPGWLNDAVVSRGNSHHVFPYTREAAREWIRTSRDRDDALILAIVERSSDRHVGNISLERISALDATADLAILVGDRAAWGRWYGTEAARLICDYGFRMLGLERITCGTFEDNEAMRRLALSLGMREEGRRRAAVLKEGRRVDVIEYGMLRSEFIRTPGEGVR